VGEPGTGAVKPMRTSVVVAVAAAWFAAALALGAAGVVEQLRPPVPQLILLGLTVLLLIAPAVSPPFRAWALGLDPRAVVALHLTRLFAGGYFLVLYGRGEMPYSFAVPAGWGDIATAVLALVLLLTVRPGTRTGRRLYFAWNVVGLIDILGVVANAATQAMRNPESMRALLILPCSLLPTFLVPLIIASHVLLFAILARRGRAASA
jgi:hypothetical protein